MALKSVTKMLSQRLFSRGTRGIVTNTGGRTETSKHITDENLRSICERVEQATADAKQLCEECNAVFALKRAFPMDRVIWSSVIFGLGINAVQQFQEIVETRNAIKDKKNQLSARRNAIKDTESPCQELRLPALSA
ncbi:hypothetical protein C5167_031271 [Papaver somniferum]|uniref:uncharacterized protein LOC113333912 n=1 Tax=Papaver somniferum TaxID=3469 RepID=UPI000E6F4EE3|nr:uncharacterized protein LOC113333912 [Papaver somniferum]RZC88899.1 hypothetical protein C5167_031271 [Papaver somniferum]